MADPSAPTHDPGWRISTTGPRGRWTNQATDGSFDDLGELYRSLSPRLKRIVRAGVQAPEPVIEDACQFAWSRLVHHRGRVRREAALPWLVKTAIHEAVKLVRRAGREPSLEAALEQGTDFACAENQRGPEAVTERRDQLRTLRSLSDRQQKLLWLFGLGLSYEEIARRDGCTSRSVERQLQRARTTLRAMQRD